MLRQANPFKTESAAGVQGLLIPRARAVQCFGFRMSFRIFVENAITSEYSSILTAKQAKPPF